MKRYFYIIISILVITTACTKTTQDIDSSIDIAVVESFLSPGHEAIVRLTTPTPYTTDTTLVVVKEISDLELYINSDSTYYLLSEIEDSAGYYRNLSGELNIENGMTYGLEFSYQNQQINSLTYIPTKPENFITSVSSIEVERITEEGGMGGMPNMTEIQLSWDDDNNDFYLIYIQYTEDEYDTINTIIEIDDAEEMSNFSSEPMQDNEYTIRSFQFMFFGEYRIVLSRITEDYAQLYEALNQSSLDGLIEPPTNITNGKGIFTAYDSDTLYINVNEE